MCVGENRHCGKRTPDRGAYGQASEAGYPEIALAQKHKSAFQILLYLEDSCQLRRLKLWEVAELTCICMDSVEPLAGILQRTCREGQHGHSPTAHR